jgi:acyl-CoA thioesterase
MARPEIDQAREIVAQMLEEDEYSRWLGVDVVEVRPNFCTLSMRVRREMLNGFGVCHGGVTFSLADSALAFASNTNGRVTVSIDASMSYPTAARLGDLLTATAEEEGTTANLAFFRVVVRNQTDTTVALFRGTVYRTKREHQPTS